ncbi:hypothetical protein OAK19_03845 [Aureispira]|nr:hypothetical protein [Aureispira sp.]
MKKKYLTILLVTCFTTILSLYFYYKDLVYTASIDSKMYVVNKLDASLTIYDLKNASEISCLNLGGEPHEAITTINQEYIIVSEFGKNNKPGNSLHVISTLSNKVTKEIDLKNNTFPHGLALTKFKDQILVTSEGTNSLLVVNVKSGEIEKQISTLQKGTHMVVAHPFEPIAYCANIESGSLSVINYKEGELIKNIKCGAGTEGITISLDGREVWVGNVVDNTIDIIDTEKLIIKTTIQEHLGPCRLATTVDGENIAAVSPQTGSLVLYDTKTKELNNKIQFPGLSNIIDKLINGTSLPVGLLFHPEYPFLFVTNSNVDKTAVISTESWEIIGSFPVGDIPDGMALTY